MKNLIRTYKQPVLVLTMRFEKSEEQRLTENDAFAKDRETSFQNTMFYRLEIMYSIFYY